MQKKKNKRKTILNYKTKFFLLVYKESITLIKSSKTDAFPHPNLSFFILASSQLWSSYHLLPDHTLLLGRWSTPSRDQSGHCFWEPGWSHRSGQHLLLQWLGQPRRSGTQFQAWLIHQVILHLKLFSKFLLKFLYMNFRVKPQTG